MLENPFYYNEDKEMNAENKQKLEALKVKLETHADMLLVGVAASEHSWSIVAWSAAGCAVLGFLVGLAF